MSLTTYLPQDRLRAIARGQALPDRTLGSALLADITGFTSLTEGLHQSLGPRLGAEELTRHLGEIYDALIAEIERYGGSVLGFAGDAVICWFDGSPDKAARRAAASAMAMQAAMRTFAEILLPDGATTALTLKIAIATGPARRFVVGDSRNGLLDLLAGATITRTATAEHLSAGGEVLLDEATVEELGHKLAIREWRQDETTGDRLAVVERYTGKAPPIPYQPPPELAFEFLQPWVLPAVYERESAGQHSFLTEFRPCTALFVRFVGIEYDADEAGEQLDSFIRKLQNLTSRYDGALLSVTIGDKGSYAYLNFGALNAHEDDPRRAIKTALALQEAAGGLGCLAPLQIGITQGVMRVGAYGGDTRRAFSAMGDDVNLAARLMTTAREGEIVVSGHVHKAVRDDFAFEPRPPLPMKGKADPLPVFAVTGGRRQRAVRLQEPSYALPMVGRQEELDSIEARLNMAAEGQGQVIGIVAEAGLGKSRLVAEVIRSARRKGFAGFGGACQSDGVHTPYLAWKPVWQAFFDVDPEMSQRKTIRWLEGEIEDRAPSRLDAMPLLNVVLDLNIPENDFTQNLKPKIRQSALHALLEDCLKTQAASNDGEINPVLIVIEDLHWIDALSYDLLEQLAKALANYAVCFVLAYRPPQMERLQSPRIEALEQFTKIELHELTQAEAESAVRAKLVQLYPARGGALPAGLVEALMRRAQGNPFYLEELLNYVRDRGLDPSDIQNLDLPDSLYTLILSRIDQLSESEKTTLRVASIIGRLFRAHWLTGYYPELGSFPQVKAGLDILEALDITPLDSAEPELAYLFKHMVTYEVTYESLPFATRARLHEQLARYLESADVPVETIAFHYGRSENKDKQIEYLRKAGEAAQKNFANDAALEYYGKLLTLLTDGKEQAEIHLKRGQVLELMGKWADTEAKAEYRAAMDSAKDDMSLQASAQLAMGNLNHLRGELLPALDWLERAKTARLALQDTAGLARVLIETGNVLERKGDYARANKILNEGLALAREVGDNLNTAQALKNLGHVVSNQGDDAAAWELYEQGLALAREIGDKPSISDSLNVMGIVAMKRGDYAAARALYEESLALMHEIGDKHGIMVVLHNVGYVFYYQGDYHAARALFEEILAPTRDMDDKTGVGYVLLGLGLAELAENHPNAREHILHSLRLRQETGEQVQQTSSLIGAAAVALHDGKPQFAAQLLGAVESALKTRKAAVAEEVLHFHTQTLAKVRGALSDDGFQSAWEGGTMWALEETVKKVLGDDK